jgi:hypothetical protein
VIFLRVQFAQCSPPNRIPKRTIAVAIQNFYEPRDNRCAKSPILDFGGAYRDLKEEFDAEYRRVMDSSCYIRGQELERFDQNSPRIDRRFPEAGLPEWLAAAVLSLPIGTLC